jgi:hypothetical protein
MRCLNIDGGDILSTAMLNFHRQGRVYNRQ